MLKPEGVQNKAMKPGPEAAAKAPAAAAPDPRCRLCGGPCTVTPLAGEAGWELQTCPCVGPHPLKRRAAAKGATHGG